MCYHLKTNSGGTVAVIDDNCGISKFYAIASTLADELKINFLRKTDEGETLYWDFKYKKFFLTLHYNIFNGVSILPGSHDDNEKSNRMVLEIANHLERRAF